MGTLVREAKPAGGTFSLHYVLLTFEGKQQFFSAVLYSLCSEAFFFPQDFVSNNTGGRWEINDNSLRNIGKRKLK